MPAGLVVNELLTNSFKHGFAGRDGGTITLHSLINDAGCRVIIADDGVGFPEGVTWPVPGKLGAIIAQSLRQNAKARIEVESAPDAGVRVTIYFDWADVRLQTPD
jgi:two-component sensor histidine kinase